MSTDINFKIDVWLSKDCYWSKPTSVDYQRMEWVETTLTLTEFIASIRNGYSYCHIYSGSRRLKANFSYSQVVSIDVDDTCICLSDFIQTCPFVPTFAYETFSNGKDNLFSYRLVYIFEEHLNASQFECAYKKLVELINLSDTKDHCGKVLTQLMNGTTTYAYIYTSYNIYSVNTDIKLDTVYSDSVHNSTYKTNYSKQNFRSNINIINNNLKQYKSKEPFCKNDITDYDEPLSLLEKDRKEFLDFYNQIFKRLVRHSKIEYNSDGYCVIPAGYLSLYVRYGYSNGKSIVNRFRDGEKRRNRLYIDGCLIRKIKPDITFLELLYNLVHLVYYYYDNSDGILSNELIVQKAMDVMKADVHTMQFDTINIGRLTTSPSYCINHNISRRRYARTAMMIENYSGISEWYDEGVSVNKNYNWARENNISVSLSTLKRYCKYNGITTNPAKTDISSWYRT